MKKTTITLNFAERAINLFENAVREDQDLGRYLVSNGERRKIAQEKLEKTRSQLLRLLNNATRQKK